MRNATFALALLLSVSSQAAVAGEAHWTKSANGVTVEPTTGPASKVEVSAYADGLFHVVASPRDMSSAANTPSLMVIQPPAPAKITVTETAGKLILRSAKATAEVTLADGNVRFLDAKGRELLAESGSAVFGKAEADGKPYVSVSQQFNRGTDEGLYGLGQHQNSQMNYNGEDVDLAQHNMDIAVPFLVSTRGYGLLWDNNGISRFGNPKPYDLAGQGSALTVSNNAQPGFLAEYKLDGQTVLTRQEASINYQYLKDVALWPKEAKSTTTAATGGQNTAGNSVRKQTVAWNGDLTAKDSGVHKFQLYASSYYKVTVDGKVVLDRWRQNWNPWYANFEVPMTAGKPVSIRIEWEPNQGYMALLHGGTLPTEDRHSVWFTSDVAKAKNYWFVSGGSMDGAIAGYRKLTGKAEMMPKWAYGFWQSRQRYNTQDEVTGVVDRYRALNIPIDNVVQDWFYWRENDWGSHQFDPARFPKPEEMVDHLHKQNARVMISVWPKFYPTTDTFKELDAKGLLYQGNLRQGNKDWVGPGYASTYYDPYSAEGRKLFWQRIEERLAKKGIDAWWADASEPDMHSNLSIPERIDTMGPTAMGPAAEFFNSYPLMNARSFFDGWTKFKPDIRPFLLTRSGFGGLQRYGSAVWSGDVASRWYDLRAQISAGVNLSMSGLPNWTHDIGGFALEERYSKTNPSAADLDEWRELNLRWFQFGAFSPLFRSHGEVPYREIYEIAPEGSSMRASMIWYNELRYRLMPYIYTLGADAWMKDGSMMRGLAMDFPADRSALNINDQYLFGGALMVAPVTEYKARNRTVYFPGTGTTWYDFTTGKAWAGGTTATVDAPYEKMPLFVRAGSILPVGPVTQYVDQHRDAPLTLAVYAGANGQFSIYEDDGVSLGYKRGKWSRIPLSYNTATQMLSIGARQGAGWNGMPVNRKFRVVLLSDGKALADVPTGGTLVDYTGKAISVKVK